MKMYIALLDGVPDHMAPVVVAHAVLGAHLNFIGNPDYDEWLKNSFRKCVVRVNSKEFEKIRALDDVYEGYESSVLKGEISCAIPCPRAKIPNVLKYAKLWKPFFNY